MREVAVIGVGMKNNSGVASIMFTTLARENINISMISTSEIRISCVVDEKYAELAVRVLHSAFGLDAASGVQSYLKENKVGFAVGSARVPIVPQAILFDLLNGGDKEWGRRTPYQELAYTACESAAANFASGTAGAGYGATTLNLKGGLGSASFVLDSGVTVGALAAVNAAGSAVMPGSDRFWAWPFEQDGEFGGKGPPAGLPDDLVQVIVHQWILLGVEDVAITALAAAHASVFVFLLMITLRATHSLTIIS